MEYPLGHMCCIIYKAQFSSKAKCIEAVLHLNNSSDKEKSKHLNTRFHTPVLALFIKSFKGGGRVFRDNVSWLEVYEFTWNISICDF